MAGTNLIIRPSTLTVAVGETATVRLLISSGGTESDIGSSQYDYNVGSSNNSIATLDRYGNVTGVGVGTATVSLSSTIGGDPLEATATITVVSANSLRFLDKTGLTYYHNKIKDGLNEVYIGDEQDAPANTKILIDDGEVGFIATPENTYTTTETRVGTWINNKPIYRKVFTGTMANNNDFYTLIEDVDYFNIESCVAGADLRPYEYFILASSNCGAIDFVIVDGDLKIRARANSVFGFPYIAVIRYTKTTD